MSDKNAPVAASHVAPSRGRGGELGEPKSGRVLLVHWGRTGAGPRLLLELASAYSAGHPEEVVVSFNSDAELAPAIGKVPAPVASVRTYRTKREVITNLWRLPLLNAQLRRCIRRWSVDTVVCVMEGVYQSLVVPLALPRSTRYIVCVHDWRSHPGDHHWMKSFNRRLELGRADVLLAFSDAVQGLLNKDERSRNGAAVVRSVLPAYGAGGRTIAARVLPRGRPVVVGFFGRLLEYKGLDTLVSVASIFAEAAAAVQFRVVGDGPVGDRLAGQGTNVRWDVGWVPEGMVPAVLDSFDVLLLPYSEASQSGALAQAMALGIPCVVTPIGGLIEQVAGSGCGVVASGVDAESVASAILTLLGEDGLYQRCSEAGIAAAAGPYSWSTLIDDIRDSAGRSTGRGSSVIDARR